MDIKLDKINLKRCLITGANGFVGRALCRVLKQQDLFVRGLLRTPKSDLACDEYYIGDLQKLSLQESVPENKLPKAPEKAEGSPENPAYADVPKPISKPQALMQDIDTVFHLAGIAHATRSRSISKETYWQVNVEATETLLHLAHQAGVQRFIYFSSVKACGDPSDAYGYSKKVAEDRVLFFGKKYGMHVTILRPALVYGPNVKGNLALMLRGIQQGWFPVLPETHNQRSLVSIEDLIDAALTTATASQANGKIYTITDGVCYSSRQLYDAMRKALGKSPAGMAVPQFFFQVSAKIGDVLQRLLGRDLPFNTEVLDKLLGSAYYPNVDIQNELGWKPKYNFYTLRLQK